MGLLVRNTTISIKIRKAQVLVKRLQVQFVTASDCQAFCELVKRHLPVTIRHFGVMEDHASQSQAFSQMAFSQIHPSVSQAPSQVAFSPAAQAYGPSQIGPAQIEPSQLAFSNVTPSQREFSQGGQFEGGDRWGEGTLTLVGKPDDISKWLDEQLREAVVTTLKDDAFVKLVERIERLQQ